MVTAAMKLKDAFSLEEMTNVDSILKSQRHYFADKGTSSQSYGFFSSHVWMWKLDHKEGWELKNFLMQVTEESEEAGLKLNIQKTKIMASGPITSWHVDRENMETVSDFIFLCSKINVDKWVQPWN